MSWRMAPGQQALYSEKALRENVLRPSNPRKGFLQYVDVDIFRVRQKMPHVGESAHGVVLACKRTARSASYNGAREN